MRVRKHGDTLEVGDFLTFWVGWYPFFEVMYDETGYDSGNAELHLALFGLHIVIRLPWVSRRFPHGDCDPPSWGISIHDRTVFFHHGGKGNGGGVLGFSSWDIPFINYGFAIRSQAETIHTIEDDDGYTDYITLEDIDEVWKNCTTGNVEDTSINYSKCPFTDKYDGTELTCTYWIEEREWRPKWLKWTRLFRKVRRTVEMQFSTDVGPDKDSWKGGTVSMGRVIQKGENPLDIVRKVESEGV